MKIGIMTFWWSDDNYGQVLQCFALQKYLRSCGHDAYLIRYRIPDVIGFNWRQKLLKYGLHPWRLFSGMGRILARHKGTRELKAHPRGLQEFIKQHLNVSDRVYHNFADLKNIPPIADMYIVGSDQVWRFGADFRKDDCRAMLLDFGLEHVARVAYAPSFGRTNFSCSEIKNMGALMQRFKAISVREKSGLSVCNQAGVDNASWVCDPTLLLPASAYAKIMTVVKPVKKYVFCYMLNNACAFKYPLLKQWADRQGLEIVYVPGNMLKRCSFQDDPNKRQYLGLPEWLGFLSQAEYVVTNSFHCCIFALKFRRKLGVVLLNGQDAEMNARIDSLDALSSHAILRVKENCFDVLLVEKENSFLPNAAEAGIKFLDKNIG